MSGIVILTLRILMAGLLYAFLGWSVWVLWKNLQHESIDLSFPQAPVLSLSVQQKGTENSQQFHNREVMIGRDLVCDFHLEDATISARHARLSFHQGQWWVEDLHSRNGTLLNLEQVSEPIVVTSGDRLQCGQVEIKISLNDEVRFPEKS
jgi:hypothetical protein